MAEALQLVKQAYGADGVILHTRTYKQGGILGIGARQVVEVTAGRGQDIGRQKRKTASRSPRAVALANAAKRREALHKQKQLEEVQGNAGDLIKRTYAAARAELEKSQANTIPADTNAAAVAQQHTVSTTGVVVPQVTGAPNVAVAAGSHDVMSQGLQPQNIPSPHAPQPHVVVAPAPNDHVAEELKAVKRMVSQMMRDQASRAAQPETRPDMPDKLFDQYLALLEQEVAEELVQEIIAQVREELTDEQLADDDACKEAVRRAVAELIPTDKGADAFSVDDESSSQIGVGPRKIALIGPTGVGKTTTVAKLAATFKLRHNKKVALVTLDTYRIAAVDQLRTYASIIGVPLHVVTSPNELTDKLAQCRDYDVVLIDTAGRAPRNDSRLLELSQFIEAAQPHEVHLVLSSTCTQTVLMDAVERFSKIRTDRIIFTKLDEAVTFGVVLNVARKVNKQLSYITTGQEVPHQIEPGHSDRLAALVMGEGDLHS